MSEGSSGSDDLVAKQKEFLEAFFKKGAEFTEELLRENEKQYRPGAIKPIDKFAGS